MAVYDEVLDFLNDQQFHNASLEGTARIIARQIETLRLRAVLCGLELKKNGLPIPSDSFAARVSLEQLSEGVSELEKELFYEELDD